MQPRLSSVGTEVDVGPTDSMVLFERWTQLGDARAREVLVERFLPLAYSLARRYARSSVPLEDLTQVASVGLVKAMDRFDPVRGLAFSTFAVPTIVGELKRYFRDSGWAVHVARGAQELSLKVEKAGALLADQTGRPPTVSELARYIGISGEEVVEGQQAAQAHAALSLDAPYRTDDGLGQSYIDTLGEEDRTLALSDTAVTVRFAIEQLPRREQRILQLRFTEDLTQSEIAEQIGVSQMQVSRLLRASLQRLRELTGDTQSREEERGVCPGSRD